MQAREGSSVTLDHPQVGELTLNREKLAVGGSAGQLLVVFHADRGTDNAEKLGLPAFYQASPHLMVARPAGGTPVTG